MVRMAHRATDPDLRLFGRAARTGEADNPEQTRLWHQMPDMTPVSPVSPGSPGPQASAGLGAELAVALEGLDTILVLAGATPTRGAALDEAGMIAANLDLSLAILAAARTAGVGRVLLASSAAVYGPQDDPALAIPETAPLRPQNAYGRSKVAMEEAVAQKDTAGGPETCCLRISTIAGADMLLQNALNATPDAPLVLDQFADGTGPARSYIGPDALGRILLDLCQFGSALPGALNIAGQTPVHMDALLVALGDLGHPVPWTWRPAPETALARVELDTSRLRRLGLPSQRPSQQPGQAGQDIGPDSGPDIGHPPVRNMVQAALTFMQSSDAPKQVG